MAQSKKDMEKIINLCKSRGFIFPGSEIYGGLANSWDFGPLGVELKNNIKKAWWKRFVQESEYNVGLDSAILMNPQVWVASGHVGGFSDPLMDCKECKTRHRADEIIEAQTGQKVEGWSASQMMEYITKNDVSCPNCGSKNFTEIRNFNLMFKTYQGVTENNKNEIFLRPETAQGIFINFSNILRTTRKKIPFGVGQIGKSFRNEITPGNFIFRTREFEQMELEFFCKPGSDMEWFSYWKAFCYQFLLDLGLNKDNINLRDHSQKELSHYSKATTDIEYLFPFGWGELWGIADRSDFDLLQHMKHSSQSLEYFDSETNEKYTPYVIEPSLGVERLALAFLTDAYEEQSINKTDIRNVLHLSPVLAPIKAAVLPLSKKLKEGALSLFHKLSKNFNVEYDETGSIGKRYRRQDEIGTPLCVTYDFDSQNTPDHTVTIRNRDTMLQDKVSMDKVETYINDFIKF